MKQAIHCEEAAELIPDGATLMIGGFMGVGSPHRLIDAIVARGVRDLTVIGNDTAYPGCGIGKLITSGQIARVITSHIGLNPETQRKMFAGEIAVDLVPQGTLAERIRAAGYGLGGVLVKTGIGTLAAEGKQSVEVDGESWLLEKPLPADFALIHANQADYAGNLAYQLTSTNFNPVMAMAARTVICEAREILPIGMITPDQVNTPGVLVDYLIGVTRVVTGMTL
jgi:acetate CoA/acetoacetate CoA-transferase alpha subunit